MSNEPGLVPELTEGFGYLVLGNAHLMLDQIDQGRTWATGTLEAPLGRGINLEIQVAPLDAAWERLTQAQWPIFVEPEEKWYRAGDVEIGVRQFLIQDPDGYLVRLQEEIGGASGSAVGSTQQRLRAAVSPTR